MRLGIGIDTGGTCTDAVLYDYDEKKLLASAKALTTHHDLTIGINNALKGLPSDLAKEATTLALSTTLATNACVEEKGGRAKLILYGANKDYVMRIIGKNGNVSGGDIIFYDSQTTPYGEIKNMPDWDEMLTILKESLKDEQAAAVVEIYSNKTGSALEKKTQELLLGQMDIPVVCGYELFHELDFIKRGTSSLLNARLIPVIDDFLKAVSISAKEYGIDCDPVIVRSDGSLMSKDFARLRPVETLLCGPVASVMGAHELTDTNNALVVDMGGTTTDIAFIRNTEPLRVNGGIHIGNWNTFVKGLFVDTFALGGDSGIVYTMATGIYVDNRRTIPLCVFANEYPYVKEELARFVFEETSTTRPIYEYYMLVDEPKEGDGLTSFDLEIVEALREKPLNLMNLSHKLVCAVYDIDVTRLESAGIIMRASLTPTDVMHVRGDYTAFDVDVARDAVQVMANCAGITFEEACDTVYDLVKEKLYANLCRIILEQEFAWVRREGLGDQMKKLIHESWLQFKAGGAEDAYVNPLFKTSSVLIGIGGPIHVFLPDVAKALQTTCVVPENAAVANAIGAAVCEVSFTITVHMTPQYNSVGGIEAYEIVSPGDLKTFADEEDISRVYDEALAYAKERARICAIEEAKRRGLSSTPEISILVREKIFSGFNAVSDILVEASV